MRHAKWILFVGCGCLAIASGCTLRNTQLTTCQAEKEQLLTTIRTQRDTTKGLQTQVASLESRLDQAEKELARSSTGTRLSSAPSRTSEPSISSPQPSSAPSSLLKSDGLPWRSPSGKTDSQAPATDNRRGSASPSSNSASLLALARRDRRIEYDATKHAARVDLPISFEDQSPTISAEGKRQLDDLARLLKSGDARELRVMVAGSAAGRSTASVKDGEERIASARQLGTARAQAVADYLDRHGIAQERLAVSGAGTRSDATASGVRVYLLDSDAPAVAWWPGGESVRR